MKNPFSSKDLSEGTRRRVELAIAVSQERLLNTHVEHALRLIRLVANKVPFENALGIYTRLLRLSDDEARVITTRALATLGEQAARSDVWPELVTKAEAQEVADESTTPRNFLKNMRSRMRGRVKDDLRNWVELSAAKTEVAILETHVDNALSFVELLDKDQAFSESVELYFDALEVRESMAEIAYYVALARIADRELPSVAELPAERDPGTAVPPVTA
ncbi:MAG: hypothetical protein ABIV28_07045 [Longimicrobiales bacterium]